MRSRNPTVASYVEPMTATESADATANTDLTAADVSWNLETLLDGVDAPDDLLDSPTHWPRIWRSIVARWRPWMPPPWPM